MPKCKIVDGHKKIDGKMHKPGDIVECSEEMAAQLRLETVDERENTDTDLATDGTEAAEEKEDEEVMDNTDTDRTQSKKKRKKK